MPRKNLGGGALALFLLSGISRGFSWIMDVLGIGGLPDDVRTWAQWLSSAWVYWPLFTAGVLLAVLAWLGDQHREKLVRWLPWRRRLRLRVSAATVNPEPWFPEGRPNAVQDYRVRVGDADSTVAMAVATNDPPEYGADRIVPDVSAEVRYFNDDGELMYTSEGAWSAQEGAATFSPRGPATVDCRVGVARALALAMGHGDRWLIVDPLKIENEFLWPNFDNEEEFDDLLHRTVRAEHPVTVCLRLRAAGGLDQLSWFRLTSSDNAQLGFEQVDAQELRAALAEPRTELAALLGK